MKAVIMAGGFGTRIQPLTTSTPKPMLDVVNVPMMEHILNKVKKAGIKDIVILLYFKPEVIKNYFGNGEKWGVNIEYVLPDDDYGTAGAVGCARELLDEDFIIISGDLVTDFDLNEILEFHKTKKSLLTITLTPVENPLQFGVVITDKNDKIIKFLEKPSWGEVFSDTINTGIYVLDKSILEYIPKNANFDFSKDLFPKLMAENIDLWGCNVKGYWRDVGNPDSYLEVHKDILKDKMNLDIDYKQKKFENGILLYKNEIPEVINVIGKVVLDENVNIKQNVILKNCAIGKNCIIENDSVIEDSVIWQNVIIDKNAQIRNSVICNDTKIGRNFKITKGAIIAENCKIEDNVEIIKNVTIWADKVIEKGAIVSQNIVVRESYKANIFNKGSVVGGVNVELTSDMADKIAEAFGSIFPEKSKIYISRDYHHASRMIKRFIAGGLMAVGIEIIDLKAVPANVMRHILLNDEEAVGGIHIRQSILNPEKTEITLYTSDAMHIDSKISDSIQRIYFRENFRRVDFKDIGDIKEFNNPIELYKQNIEKLLDKSSFKGLNIAVDLMYGMTSEVYPALLNNLGIKNIVLNAYASETKLLEIKKEFEDSKRTLSNIVNSLNLDFGILIYPNGEKIHFVDEDVSDIEMLLIVLKLLDNKKVFLPSWGPDILDDELNVEISRGKLMGKTKNELKEFDLIANIEGGYAFSEFGINRDAIFASFKIMELLLKQNKTLNELKKELPKFYYEHIEINTPSDKKGLLMRKFLESGEKYEHNDGIKIYEDTKDWVLMIPDDYDDKVHLYIQAINSVKGLVLKDKYISKITDWINE